MKKETRCESCGKIKILTAVKTEKGRKFHYCDSCVLVFEKEVEINKNLKLLVQTHPEAVHSLKVLAMFQHGASLNDVKREFTSKDGYWDDCPVDKQIPALHIALPFTIRKMQENGQLKELPQSTVMLSGYDKYYFAKRASNIVPIGQGKMLTDQAITVEKGACMAGIDVKRDFVLFIEVDKRGNIITKRYSIATFTKAFGVKEASLRNGKND